MRKEGTDESNAKPSDFLCDYCGGAWDDNDGNTAMIEGHKGSLICGKCLSVAYRQVVLAGENSADEEGGAYSCTMCLLTKAITEEPAWSSPATGAVACRWCINRAATMLSKDPDCGWSKPV